MDSLSPSARSENMRRIKSVDTNPEITVRRILHRLGFRFRLYRGSLPGKPDLVLPKHKTVIFVNGCFWHGHGCRRGRIPRSNAEYWIPKITRNKQRDEKNYTNLQELGWRPIVIWECETKHQEVLAANLPSILVDATYHAE